MGQLIALLVAWLLVKLFYRPPRMNYLYCGIAGFSGPRAVDETKLRWLLSENLSRGKDSTGVYGNHLYKDAIESRDFILQPGFKAAIKGCKTIGAHTRAATVGGKTKENAHPFRYGTDDEWAVVGAHNGFIIPEVVDRHTEDLGFPRNHFNVDSQIIFAALHKTGDINIISKLEGAMAIWFIFPNKDKDTIYLYRRANSRDLNIGQAPEGLYFSSEAGPLRLIGCDRVYTLAGDVLYTLRKGEIIDRYQMNLPLVKSLGANVSRSNWRLGTPTAEINALLPTVNSHGHQRATSRNTSSTSKGQMSLIDEYNARNAHDNVRHMTSHKYADDDTLADALKSITISDKKDLEAFYMYIRTIKAEITNLEAPVVDYLLTHSYPYPDFMGCILNVKLVNMDDGKPLEGWTIINEGDVDMCGITTPIGCSLLKIPPAQVKSGVPIEFVVYDPIDRMGPFKLSIRPTRSRVMEVTLNIPFRKVQKEAGPQMQNNMDCEGAGHVSGCDTDTVHIPGSIQSEIRLPETSGNDCEVLQTNTGQLHSRQASRISNGNTDKREVSSDLIPKTIYANGKIKPTLSIVNVGNRFNKRAQLTNLTKKLSTSAYATWKPTERVLTFMNSDPDVFKWKGLYENAAANDDSFAIDITSLITDAARVRGWDMYFGGTYYSLPVYIQLLINELPNQYLAQSDYILAVGDNPHVIVDRYNPFLLEKTVDRGVRNVSYKYFCAYVQWIKDSKHIMKLAKTKLEILSNEAKQVAATIEFLVDELQEGLETNSEGGTRMCDSKLRAAAIKARNYLRSELSDTKDFYQQIDAQIRAIEKSDEEMAQERLGASSCID